MLTFKSLGKKGNLGNQLFQIASTIGIAKKNGHEFVFPEWPYAKNFNYNFQFYKDGDFQFKQIVENSYAFYEWNLDSGNFDVNGALQSEKYFDRAFTKKVFEFKTDFVKELLEKHQYLFEKETIFISVRRGDFVYHPDYYQLPYQYYFLALKENFPNWKERNLIFTSDDIKYCKYHFGFLENAIFLENLSAIEQLAVSSHGKDFIISNSTFSWWCAWLGEKENSKIVRPLKNFRGEIAKINDDSDYFPDRWISFDFKKKNIELKYLGLTIKGKSFQIFDFTYFALTQSVLFLKKIINKVFYK